MQARPAKILELNKIQQEGSTIRPSSFLSLNNFNQTLNSSLRDCLQDFFLLLNDLIPSKAPSKIVSNKVSEANDKVEDLLREEPKQEQIENAASKTDLGKSSYDKQNVNDVVYVAEMDNREKADNKESLNQSEIEERASENVAITDKLPLQGQEAQELAQQEICEQQVIPVAEEELVENAQQNVSNVIVLPEEADVIPFDTKAVKQVNKTDITTNVDENKEDKNISSSGLVNKTDIDEQLAEKIETITNNQTFSIKQLKDVSKVDANDISINEQGVKTVTNNSVREDSNLKLATPNNVVELPDEKVVSDAVNNVVLNQKQVVSQTSDLAAKFAEAFSKKLEYTFDSRNLTKDSNAIILSQVMKGGADGQLLFRQNGGETNLNQQNSGSNNSLFRQNVLSEAAVARSEVNMRNEISRLNKSSVKTVFSPTTSSQTLERVESALKEIARSKDGNAISVRLDPPNLGSVKIDVTLRDGSLHARLVAENPSIANLLRDKSYELQALLRKSGLQFDNINIAVRSEESFNTNTNSNWNKLLNERATGHRGSLVEDKALVGSGTENITQGVRVEGNGIDHWVA